MRSVAQGFGVFFVLAGLGIMAVSCGSAEPTYDFSYPGAPCDRGYAVCNSDSDCWAGLVYEAETRCIDDHCICPVDGHVICNKKGHPLDDNMRGCRRPEECEPGEVCQPEAPPPPPPPEPECTETDLSKCPGPPDKRCGSVTCTEGVCGIKIVPGPIASQKAGDCTRLACDYAGEVVEEEDPSDYYDDGIECTFDYCEDSAIRSAAMEAIQCPDTGEGYCSADACVQCVDHVHCTGGDICILGRCISTLCANNQLDAPETDVDCGGECLPCSSGFGCLGNSDCRSNVCLDMECQAPTCEDTERNDGETDTDCGAACKDPAKLCGDGKGCKAGEDCVSGVCWAGKCQAATCSDGVQNEKETGVDCGGSCEGC